MEVYHASMVRVERPDVYHSRKFLDFGQGFYVTTLKDQAVKYAQRFIRRQGGRIKMRSPPKVLTGNFRPSQLSFFLS